MKLSRHIHTCALSFILAAWTQSCTQKPSRVPVLTADDLPRVKWPHVKPRSTWLTAKDERQIPIKESDAAVATARDALTGALQKSQVSVAADSPNRLELILDYADEMPVGNSQNSECIKTTLRLKFAWGKAETWGVGCYQARDIALGPGADATDALRDALTEAMKALDDQLGQFKDRDGDRK
ncbi:MAG TPA: hypothetical protein VN764_05270 [Polyangiaceae bacterium]|nr:hypothetical protein [Polyangiaceae bacterium]